MNGLLAFVLIGCDVSQVKISTQEPSDDGIFLVDEDGDGFLSDEDCDDLDDGIFPGAAELCDGIDNDCDQDIDEDVQSTYFEDADGDGFGNPESSINACTIPEGWVITGTDCNDEEPSVFPTATEICDGLDNNCNDLIDGDDADLDSNAAFRYHLDEDGDGFGSSEFIYACEQPEGYSENDGDCNDLDSAVNPSADEICDEIDNDCDMLIDTDDDSMDDAEGGIYYPDSDNDGFGNESNPIVSCSEPIGYTATGGDCADNDTFINPDAPEVCDTIDNDCDSLIDDEDDSVDGSSGTLFFTDSDGDGFGDPNSTQASCLPSEGMIAISGDCDDESASTFPGSAELESAEDCLNDADNDGYAPTASGGQDCDDTKNFINPDVTDIVGDGVDQNCDLIDGLDQDGDGVASSPSGGGDCDDNNPLVNDNDYDADGSSACAGDCNDQDASFNTQDSDQDGVTSCDGDCDDNNPNIYPGAAVEDGIEDCVLDSDGDGFASVDNGGSDCNDDNAEINPTATELCDGVDNNCNNETDEGETEDGLMWYEDRDADQFGDADRTLLACSEPEGFVSNGEDCNDLNNAIFPGAVEYCNGIDDNCDDLTDEDAVNGEMWYQDQDGDNYAGENDPVMACTQPQGLYGEALDCDDGDNDVYPNAPELCNQEDDDCDGDVDNGATNSLTFFLDVDGDGFGGLSTAQDCAPPDGYVNNNEDCNDSSAAVNPDAEELCNAIDDNCNAQIDEGSPSNGTLYYFDGDQDSFGQDGFTTIACSEPDAYWTTQNGDCDDGDDDINPDAEEICSGEDDNCDGNIDEGSPPNSLTFYYDDDEDGFGDPDNSTLACSPPEPLWIEDNQDCNDGDDNINPDAEETCNEEDDNCNGTVDEEQLGLGELCASTSCLDVLTELPDADNGVYYIDPTGNNSYEVYCDMDAGGWTLILKSMSNNSELNYDAALWTNESVLNESDFDLVFGANSKYPAFNDMPFSEVRIYMNSVDRSFSFGSYLTSMLQAQYSGAYSTTSTEYQYFDPSYWNLTANGHERWHCRNFGINTDFYGSGGIARLGFQLSQEQYCGHPGTSEGVGLKERNNLDFLNSGRLQWQNETNYFAQAWVYIR